MNDPVMSVRNEYHPDFVSPPGETLLELLEDRGMTQTELAVRIGKTKKTVNEIVSGKAPITPGTALQLERALAVPASFWNQREHQYRDFMARKEEQERLEERRDWLKHFPIKKMIQLCWLPGSLEGPVEQMRAVLDFFGVASPEQYEKLWIEERSAVFRKSQTFASDPHAVAAWLRKGELEAQGIACSPYDAERFKEVLKQARRLTTEPPEVFCPELTKLCAEAGVALVFIPELPKTRASGAARWLTSSKALIQLSLRYKTDDHLWFSFFHEAGHILSHKKSKFFIERNGEKTPEELAADRFASNTLIPSEKLRAFLIETMPTIGSVQIRRFADELGIAPGVVVGRLQHDSKLPHNHCNSLKRRFQWAE